MVSANDNKLSGRVVGMPAGVDGESLASEANMAENLASETFPRDFCSMDALASEKKVSPLGRLGAPVDGQPAVTYTRVTDDFGDHVEIKVGEAVMLGQLMNHVIDKLRTKRANER